MRDVTVKLPTGETVIYEGVPDEISDRQVQMKAVGMEYLKDVGKASQAGAVRAVGDQGREAVRILAPTRQPLGTPGGLMSLGMKLFAPKLSKELDKGTTAAMAGIDKVGDSLGGDYKPKTGVGKFTGGAVRGAVSAALPLPVKGSLGVGAATGLATTAAQEAGLGPVGEMAAAFGTPIAAAALKRSVPQTGARTVQDVMEGTSGKELAQAALRRDAAAGQGIKLLPGQTLGPDHPLAGLQTRLSQSEYGGAIIHKALQEQAEQAHKAGQRLVTGTRPTMSAQQSTEALVKGTQDVAGARKKALGQLSEFHYKPAGQEALDPFTPYGLRADLTRLTGPGGFNLAKDTGSAKAVADAKKALFSQGKVSTVVKPSTVRRTLRPGEKGPVKGVAGSPAVVRQDDTPIQNQGQLKSIRDDLRMRMEHPAADVEEAVKAAIVDKLNQYRSPAMAEADAAFGFNKDRLVNPFKPPDTGFPTTPKALLAGAKPGMSPALADQALDANRFTPEQIREVVRYGDQSTPGLSRELLGHRFQQMWQEAQKSQAGMPENIAEVGPRFAAGLGMKGSPNRSTTDLLMARSRAPQDTQELVEALSRTAIGRDGMGQIVPAGSSATRAQAGPVALRGIGTNPWLALLGPLNAVIEKGQTRKVAEALADPSMQKLLGLQNFDPNAQFLTEALKGYMTGVGQGYGPN